MLGAIAGDIIGSYYEAFPIKETDFPLFHEYCRFTDDTVLTVAVADWILNGGELTDKFHDYFDAYPQAGFSGTFAIWAGYRKREPYNSFGNGAAMRVSAVAHAYDSLEEVLHEARQTAEVSHNHPEGIRGAQSTAAAVFLARQRCGKLEIRDHIERNFRYDLGPSLDDIRPTYSFDASCQRSVPQSIISFLESVDYESAIRNAISLGGDADTMACIAGAIAEPYYGGVPEGIKQKVFTILDEPLVRVVEQFRAKYLAE